MKKFDLILWALFLLMYPYQAFPLGTPQPADVLLVMIFLYLIHVSSGSLALLDNNLLRLIWMFAGYTSIVSLVYGIIMQDNSFIYPALYYTYNAILFTTSIILASRHRILFIIMTAVMATASLVLQCLIAARMYNATSLRYALLFNKYNQLGYFALAFTVIVFMCTNVFWSCYKSWINKILRISAMLAGGYLIWLSLSLGAATALVSSIILTMCRNIFYFRFRWAVIVSTVTIVVVFGLLTYIVFYTVEKDIVNTEKMKIRIDERLKRENLFLPQLFETTLAERGYNRIGENPKYLFFGAGEGLYERFEQTGKAQEIHSTLGTVLFSYGIIGAFLFLTIFYKVFTRTPFLFSISVLPMLIYGITHNGARSSELWLVLSICFVSGKLCTVRNSK